MANNTQTYSIQSLFNATFKVTQKRKPNSDVVETTENYLFVCIIILNNKLLHLKTIAQ